MRKKSGLGQKKEMNADLNLTPFIDLLSTCVCFLLITAVWIEIGTIEIKQSHGSDAKESTSKSFDLDIVYGKDSSVFVSLKNAGRIKKKFKFQEKDLQTNLASFSQTLSSKLENYLKGSPIASATITPRSSISYSDLIATMDVLRDNNIVNIGVLAGAK